MDLATRTLRALDWAPVLERLSRHARTLRGAARAAAPDFCDDLDAVLDRYEEIDEVLAVEQEGDHIPVGAVRDVSPSLARASRGEVLDGVELEEIAEALRALLALKSWLAQRDELAPRLAARAESMVVDAALSARLNRSLDGHGQPALAAWPELAEAKRRVEGARGRILRQLDDLLRADSFADVLQDRFYTERDGRFVLPIKASHRRGVGIVHGRSQSGETFFVEPAEVVELTNDLREAEADVLRETRRVYLLLSREVGLVHAPLSAAIEQVTAIDLAVARAGLGLELDAHIPEVGSAGVIALRRARHPVLALRGVKVVPNDLDLNSANPALVLTGPNTGGKTIALKTLGLAALFVRAGLPFPAAEGSRIDFFPVVLADVGDAQAVDEDLSTFSGHVRALREVLDAAAPGTLALLDEIAAGTDPAQGAALARAVLEALVAGGARVAITTHYAELKAMSALDGRVQVAAALYEDARPTYRLAMGIAGDSHAFGIAERLGLSPDVLSRARDILAPGSRALSDLLEALEAERERGRRHQEALDARESALAERERKSQTREEELERRAAEIRSRLTDQYRERLREREREVKGLIAALQQNPNLRDAGAALELVREASREAVLTTPPPEPAPPPTVAVGDTVIVRALNQRARVLAVLPDDRLELEAGILKMRVRRDEVDELRAANKPNAARPMRHGRGRGKAPKANEPAASDIYVSAVRRPGNTCDLRGKRVDEALDQIETFLDGLAKRGEAMGWILHGHGTGALKEAVRAWLPGARLVKRWRPADTDEGGDAFTVIEVRFLT